MTKTVLEKLGWRTGLPALFVGLPAGLEALFADALPIDAPVPNWILAFAPDQRTLAILANGPVLTYQRGGHLWLAYPKKTGAIKTDLTRDLGWEVINDLDLLPVTQIAIDATWSALRFRYRDEIQKLTRKF